MFLNTSCSRAYFSSLPASICHVSINPCNIRATYLTVSCFKWIKYGERKLSHDLMSSFFLLLIRLTLWLCSGQIDPEKILFFPKILVNVIALDSNLLILFLSFRNLLWVLFNLVRSMLCLQI